MFGETDDTTLDVQKRLDHLIGILSRRLDSMLARERDAVRELVRHLEASHSLASPLGVMTLQAELAQMRIEAGQTEAAEQHLAQILAAAERVVDQRQGLGAGTPSWCTELRRAVKAQRELESG
jgi:hypothetical protein